MPNPLSSRSPFDLRRVLVVEPGVVRSTPHARTVDSVRGLVCVGVAHRSPDALALAQMRRCDLVILDLGIGIDASERFLNGLRTQRLPVDVIVLSERSDSLMVRAMMSHGVLDYLLVPFSEDRLRQSLRMFKQRADALDSATLDQEGIDLARGFGSVADRALPHGLTRDRVVRTRNLLESAAMPLSAADLARRMGVSRVTARRYLEHLVTHDVASFEFEGDGSGRPRKMYHAAGV